MEQLSFFQMTVISAALIFASVNLVNGQISTPCTISMMSSFTPCANFITGSTNNGVIPSTTATCCDSLRSLMSTSMDCACLVISANAPILPGNIINQALALFLSQACNMNGVTAQCKASGSPLPAPGPAILRPNEPTIPPIAASPLSPQVSKTMAVGETHKYENLQLERAVAVAPASPPVESHMAVGETHKYENLQLERAVAVAVAPALPPVEAEPPTNTPGIRPVLTPLPSASRPSYVSSSTFAFIFIGIIMLFGTS